MKGTKDRAIIRTVFVLLATAFPLAVAQSRIEGQGSPQQTHVRDFWTDPATGLMWAGKDSGKDVNFKRAVRYCRDLHLAGYSDWRLANMFELQALYDKGIDSPGLTRRDNSVRTMWHVKGSVFLTGYPWANDQSKSTSGYHYYFDFNDGKSNDQPSGFMYPYYFMRALCVRGSGDPLAGQRQH